LSNWQPFLGDNPISAAYRARGLTPGAYGIHKQRKGYGPQLQGLDALMGGLAELPLVAEPGAEWNYAIGYDVLGAVIERTTGRPFADVMQDRILAPLAMQSTGFQVAAADASRLTVMYGRTGEETYVVDDAKSSDFLRPPTLVAGGGGLVSTARDMTRFAGALLLNGQIGRQSIAKPETIDQAIRLFSAPRGEVNQPLSGPAVLSAVGASSTLLHIDLARGLIVIFLAQLNRAGSPEEATRYRPELLAVIDADHRQND
jgi:CubicO group peptidase (beta-lactamase class C family)